MNPTIVKLAAQALFGRRRVWLLLGFPLAVVALAEVVILLSDSQESGWSLIEGLGYPIVLPLVAILATSSVLGPEVDDGSIIYLLAKPVSRHRVASSKWLVAWVTTLVVAAGSLFLAGLLCGDFERALGWFVAALAAGTAYSAFFLALAAVTRHAVIVGLMFVLIWESLLGSLLSGVAWLSIGQWGIRIGHEVSGALDAPANLAWALLATVVVTIVGVWFAGDRLRSFSLTGDA